VTVRAAIALGSNLGEREAHLAGARDAIARLAGTQIVKQSRVEETAPLPGGPEGQGSYLNQMLLIETELPPRELLEALLAIETAMGRVRRERWEARIIDCDIVLYGDEPVTGPDLVIPHPELPNRGFWQRELAELGIAPPS
jgi:2-amino-4-hydroxy-6-hydroxymethyldihydropteridine diphosphokinase